MKTIPLFITSCLLAIGLNGQEAVRSPAEVAPPPPVAAPPETNNAASTTPTVSPMSAEQLQLELEKLKFEQATRLTLDRRRDEIDKALERWEGAMLYRGDSTEKERQKLEGELMRLVAANAKVHLEYPIRREEELQSAIWWTNIASRTSFFFVHVFVLAGLAMALAEFRRSLTISRHKDQNDATEIKLSADGLALKSSLYGLLFLGISCAFYFLYLKFVYPVQIIGK